MASIADRLRALIQKGNQKMGTSYGNLTNVINALVSGYGVYRTGSISLSECRNKGWTPCACSFPNFSVSAGTTSAGSDSKTSYFNVNISGTTKTIITLKANYDGSSSGSATSSVSGYHIDLEAQFGLEACKTITGFNRTVNITRWKVG